MTGAFSAAKTSAANSATIGQADRGTPDARNAAPMINAATVATAASVPRWMRCACLGFMGWRTTDPRRRRQGLRGCPTAPSPGPDASAAGENQSSQARHKAEHTDVALLHVG